MQGPRRSRWGWLLALAAFVLAAGLESVRLGQDVNWDLRNYHYYNVYSWLAGRLTYDVAPAMIQTFHSPLLDIPFYAMVQGGLAPQAIAFLMAIPTGIAAYFLLGICTVLFPRGIEDRSLWIGIAMAIGITGSAGHAVIGSTMNEWPPAALLIAALYVLLRACAEREGPSWQPLLLAGLLVGFAAGAKLTYLMFAPALVVSVLSFGTMRRRLLRAATLGVAFLAGFLLAYGFWGVTLQREFANPFFPYFNDIFQSPWWEPEAFFDRRYGPSTWRQWLFFPAYFSWNSWMVGEVGFRDFRSPVLMVLAVAAGFRAYARRRFKLDLPTPDPLDNAWRVLGVFTLVAYVAWIKIFAMYRYLVPVEMLMGPLIVGCAAYLLPDAKARRRGIVLLALVVIFSTQKGNWGRIPFGEHYFEVSVPEVPANSLVILGPYNPIAYVIPFMRGNARFVSPANNLLLPEQKNLLARRVAEVIATHPGPIYSLHMDDPQHPPHALTYYNLLLVADSCRVIRSNLDADSLRLCRVERKP